MAMPKLIISRIDREMRRVTDDEDAILDHCLEHLLLGANMIQQLTRLRHFFLVHPIVASLVLLAIALLLRIADIFILRLHEVWGEILLSKALGFLTIIGYLWFTSQRLRTIGCHARHVRRSVLISVAVTAFALFAAYATEYAYLALQGQQPTLMIMVQSHSIVPNVLFKGGIAFGLWLFFGNCVNSLMEEGLFRGVLISHFATPMSLSSANMIQALLFGLWHIVWPLYYLITGKMNANQAIAVAIVYVITAGLTGLFWGYLLIRANNLWSSWISHTINNSVFNLVHTRTSNGFDLGLPIRVSTLSVIFLLLIPIVKQLTRNWRSFSSRKLQHYDLENRST
jgi:uncharacterized protein